MVGLRRESLSMVPPTGVLPPGVAELMDILPFSNEQTQQVNHIYGFFKDLKTDPYSTACTTLAKFGHMACKDSFFDFWTCY